MTAAQVETFRYSEDLPSLASHPDVEVVTAVLELDECGVCTEQQVHAGPEMAVYKICYDQWGRAGYWTDTCEAHTDDELSWLLRPRLSGEGQPQNVTLLVPPKLKQVAA